MDIKKLPMTNTQANYVKFEEVSPSVFNLSNGFLLKGKYDMERMKKAVRKLYERHDAMRMVMKKDENGFYQTIGNNIPDLEVISLKSESRDDRYNEAMQDAHTRVRQDIAFSDEGMYRFWAYELLDEEMVIMYIANHSGTDGTSMALLNMELEMLYENPDRTDIPQSSNFEDFMLERKELIESEKYRKGSEYWKAIAEKGEMAELPEHEEVTEDCISMEIGAFVVPLEKIHKIAKAGKTSNFNVVFLMYRLALYELLHKKNIFMTYIFTGRITPKYFRTFGFIAQGAGSAIEIDDEADWAENLKKVKTEMNESMKYINYSDSTVFGEYVLSYMPKTGLEVKRTFADLESTPFIIHSTSQFKGRLYAIIATEMNDVVYMYPMCDVSFYGKEFTTAFGDIMNKYADRLAENTNMSIRELIK